MNKRDWNEGLNNIDPALVEEHIEEMAKIEANARKKPIMWTKYISVAAAVCLVFGMLAVSLILNRGDDPIIPEGDVVTDDINSNNEYNSEAESGEVSTGTNSEVEMTTEIYAPIIFNAIVSPDKLIGSNSEILVNLSGGGDMQEEPPAFDFDLGPFVAKARVVDNLPDTYYKLDVDSSYEPMAYRIIQMELLELIRGLDVPKYFYYLIPEYNYVDMSIYDSLLISMWQIGTENYVLKNGTQNTIEAFSLPVFADTENTPVLGNIIAFSEGTFDESLWQNKNWFYGYQFASHKLDNPDRSDLVVYRGCSEDDAVAEVKKRINDDKEYYKEKYPDKEFPQQKLITLNFTSQEARDAVEYVKPFDNGVFSQLRKSNHSNTITFTRYINGCKTEETVTINLETEEVTYSSVSYTNEEMESMLNIAAQLSLMAQEYHTEFPNPPHIDSAGKELRSLQLYAWYVKADGKIYGVIKTVWKYWGDRYAESVIEYHDEAYVLCDMSNLSVKSISREELVEIVGWWNISRIDFGVGKEIIID